MAVRTRTARRLALTVLLTLLSSTTVTVTAITANPNPITVKQSDGTEITVRMTGNEVYHDMTDLDGNTIVKDKNGDYYYAQLDASGKSLVPTKYKVGPKTATSELRRAGIPAHVLPRKRVPDDALLATEHISGRHQIDVNNDPRYRELAKDRKQRRLQAQSGTVKNLVLLIRFSDHVDRDLPSPAEYDVLMNAPKNTFPPQAPTGSLRHFYQEYSYDQLTIESTVWDWVTVSNTEAYYADQESGRTRQLQEAIVEALQIHSDMGKSFRDFDADNNGWIDGVTVIHSGYAAEFGGTDIDNADYVDRIWSHYWILSGSWTSHDGVTIYEYHISSGLWGTSGSEISHIGGIAHETAHFLGLGDLYDYNDDGFGIGNYGLMGNSWGFTADQLNPPHMSAYGKVALGWVEPKSPRIGSNEIRAVQTHQDIYKIGDGEGGYPSGEYLLIENRQPILSDRYLAQGGLYIWHIDANKEQFFYFQGYPGQDGWPENDLHYFVALLQADGSYDLERQINLGDKHDAFHGDGVDRLLPSTDPRLGSSIYPNTDAYQDGIIVQTGLEIFDISASGTSMTFQCAGPGCTGEDEHGAPTPSPALRCNSNEDDIEVRLRTDDFPAETSWELVVNGNVVESGGSYTDQGEDHSVQRCVNTNDCVTFEISDSAQDGICCGFGQGFARAYRNGELMGVADEFGAIEVLELGCGNGVANPSPTSQPTRRPTPAPTPDPTSNPTARPTSSPTNSPTGSPTATPTSNPTNNPTSNPTSAPTSGPTPSPTGNPTSRPTGSPTLSPTASDECSVDQRMVEVHLQTDNYGGETSFYVEVDGSGVVLTAGPFEDDQFYVQSVCVPRSACVQVVIEDSANDGICCDFGVGWYAVFVDGDDIHTGGNFESREVVRTGDTCAGTTAPTSTPTQAPTREVTGPSPGGGEDCADDEIFLELEVMTDDYGYESMVRVYQDNGRVYQLLDLDSNTKYTSSTCVPRFACYRITVDDSYGDGICCAYGEGHYQILVDGQEMVSGGEFEYTEQRYFGECGDARRGLQNDASQVANADEDRGTGRLMFRTTSVKMATAPRRLGQKPKRKAKP